LGDSERCQALGIKVCLVKPIGQVELLEAISAVMGIPAVLADAAPASGTPSVPKPLRILLAEDNEVNLQLMLRLLKRRGHSVTIATDGKEALDRLAEFGFSAFDAALMDVQMPGMDGLEVAQAIRKQEQSLGTHLPIMGVTAHAMTGYRERCLRAGMDAYVTKPIRTQELFDELDRLTSNHAPAQLAPAAPDSTPATEAFDRTAALERMEGDLELLTDLIQVFLQDLPQQVAALRKAVEDQDAKGIQREAHRLKGAAASLDATAVSASAARLEQSGRDTNYAAARAEWVQLEAELVRLESAFRDFHPEAVR
jgi:CheY-like chemotaxis protein